MKDFNLHNVRPVPETRTPDKANRQQQTPQQGGGKNFQQTLQEELQPELQGITERMNALKEQAGVDAKAPHDTRALAESVSEANDVYNKLMTERQNLARLYQNMSTNKGGGQEG